MILHIVNKSPFSSDCLASCLRVISEGDALLLIEEGVYGAVLPAAHLQGLDPGVAVYALKSDVAARGLAGRLACRVATVDEGGFVDLTVHYAASQSWY